MNRKCSSCGARLQPGDKYCPYCGAEAKKKQNSFAMYLIIAALLIVALCEGYFLATQIQPAIDNKPNQTVDTEKVEDKTDKTNDKVAEAKKYKYAEITADKIIVRNNHSKSADGVGYVFKGDLVDVYSSVNSGGYTWYEIDYGYWIANDGTWLKIHETTSYQSHPYHLMECLGYVSVGNYVTFGNYEQDGNFSNGKEPILWRVLAIDGKKALLVSEQALDCRIFDDSFSTWGKSDIRKWLNGDFRDEAFSSGQKQGMMIGRNTTERNNEGKTEDFVFLLSETEVNNYLPNEYERLCTPTNYALSKGIEVNNGYCRYFLRTLNGDDKKVLTIRSDGRMKYTGTNVYDTSYGIRPAIWVRMG